MSQPTQEQIIAELTDFVSTNIVDGSIAIEPDTVLTQVGVDSFSIIELVLFLERNYGIALQEKDMLPENFKTINALATCAIGYL